MFLIGFLIGILIVMGTYLILELLGTRIPWVARMLENLFARVFDHEDHKYVAAESTGEEPDDEVSELELDAAEGSPLAHFDQ